MKRISRFLGVFLCLVVLSATLFSVNASAASNSVIDTETAAAGYFTVNYTANTNARMKVGVSYQGKTAYYDYTPGSAASYTFAQGDGDYAITLFRNVSGNSYAKVTSTKVEVAMEDEFAPYLVSTAEITFSEIDSVGLKSAELCAGLTDDASKVVAIHNYIAANFAYDHGFADSVRSGAVKNYVPNTNSVLASGKGVCYDFSALFAAMCRSQGIPCAVEKGYYNGGYHAWNAVYANGVWNRIDMTAAIARQHTQAQVLSECTFTMGGNSGYTY